MDKAPVSRGFRSRQAEQPTKDRLPPGQYVTMGFPVLSAGPTPQIKVESWNFALQFGGSLLGKWNWAEFEALPQTTITTDIHCVTKWSKLDTTWQGVTFDDLLNAERPRSGRGAYRRSDLRSCVDVNRPSPGLRRCAENHTPPCTAGRCFSDTRVTNGAFLLSFSLGRPPAGRTGTCMSQISAPGRRMTAAGSRPRR
jgi:Oxidoreductase molybdopterin binding domain